MAILTISRSYGAGGYQVGRLVARALSCDLVDRHRLARDLRSFGDRWARLDQDLSEINPTLWERHDRQYLAYLAVVQASVLAHALHKDCVILGRGGNFILNSLPFCLRVRLIAPFDLRVQRIMEREGISDPRLAQASVRQVDQERAGYIKFLFGRNIENSEHYDLICNTGGMSYEEVAELLIPALTRRQALATPEALEATRDMVLAARLKAVIAGDRRLSLPTLEVTPQDKVILVKATIHRPEDAEIIKQLCQQTLEDKPFRLELRPRA